MFNIRKTITPEEIKKRTEKNEKKIINNLCKAINKRISQAVKVGKYKTGITPYNIDHCIVAKVINYYKELGYKIEPNGVSDGVIISWEE